MRDLSEDEEKAVSAVVKKSLCVLEDLYRPTAFNYGCNMGMDAGASIPHLHYHIIPRYPHETGIADLIAGKRVLVENPLDTSKKLKNAFSK